MSKDKKRVEEHFDKKKSQEARDIAETERKINKLNKEEPDPNERLRKLIEGDD